MSHCRRTAVAARAKVIRSPKKKRSSGRRTTRVSENEVPVGFSQLHTELACMMADVRDHKLFQGFIIATIFLAGLLVGLQTYDLHDEAAIFVIACVSLLGAERLPLQRRDRLQRSPTRLTQHPPPGS